MKKLFLVIVYLLFSLTLYAQNETVEIENILALAGDTLNISVTGKSLSNIGAMTIEVEYDSTMLEYISISSINDMLLGALTGNSGNKVSLAWTDITGKTFENELLYVMKFIYAGGKSTIAITTNSEIADVEGNVKQVNFVNGSLDTIPLPSSPELVLPTYDTLFVNSDITFKWNSCEYADYYTIIVSKLENLLDPVYTQEGILDTICSTNTLEAGEDYYWVVQSVNRAGSSEYSDIKRFSILAKPKTPILFMPEDNTILPDTTAYLEFIWSSDELAESYFFEISENENFDSVIVSEGNLTDTSLTYSNELLPGAFYWRVNAMNQAGAGNWSNFYCINITLTNIDDQGNIFPSDFVLHQNYPNPFNPSTMIKYGIPEQSNIKIEIFNTLGQSVGVLVNTEKSAGYYEVTWNAANLPSGIYIVSIKAEGLSSRNNFTQVKKALLLK